MTTTTDLTVELRGLADDIFSSAVESALDLQQTGLPYDAGLWGTLAEAGLTLLTTFEENGGSGATVLEGSVVLDSSGYHAAPVPIGENDLLAAWLLQSAGLPVQQGPMTVAQCSEPLDAGRLVTTCGGVAVPWAESAETLVVLGPTFVASVPRDAYRVTDRPDIAGQPAGSVEIDTALASDRISALTSDLADEYLIRGALVRSLQTCGALSRALDMSCSHATEREQFGRPIAKFQAVQALISNAASALALARAATAFAVDAAHTHGFDAPQTRFAVTVAKVESARAATVVSRNAHQVHGAIGFTLDHRLRHFTTRALAWRNDFGSQRYWQHRLGQAALDSGGSIWEYVTANG